MQANGRIPAIAKQARKGRSRLARLGETAMAAFASARGVMLWVVLCASAATTVAAAGYVYWAQGINATIAELRAGKDVVVDPLTAPPALLEARSYFFLTRDNIKDAQPLLDQAALRADERVRSRMLYNMANARLRASVEAIQQGHFDQAIPQVALAKAEYRSALRIDPRDWDAKYNLDVAMRLVRDLPRQEGELDEGNVKEPAKLWTDLPGVPKGLP